MLRDQTALTGIEVKRLSFKWKGKGPPWEMTRKYTVESIGVLFITSEAENLLHDSIYSDYPTNQATNEPSNW
jgi:hypothetical protein